MYLFAVEITKEGKAPYMLYVTSKDLLFLDPRNSDAKLAINEYLKDVDGTKEIKFVYRLSDEQYKIIFDNQVNDSILKGDQE